MWFRIGRDACLFIGGLGVAAHEVLYVPDPRIPILALAAGMLGLPGFLVTDRKLTGTNPPPNDGDDDTPTSHRKES